MYLVAKMVLTIWACRELWQFCNISPVWMFLACTRSHSLGRSSIISLCANQMRLQSWMTTSCLSQACSYINRSRWANTIPHWQRCTRLENISQWSCWKQEYFRMHTQQSHHIQDYTFILFDLSHVLPWYECDLSTQPTKWSEHKKKSLGSQQLHGCVEQTRGLIYNRFIDTKQGLKEAHATSQEKVGMYKNTLEGRMRAPLPKLWLCWRQGILATEMVRW